ncbi:MAG: hypothetical protein QOD54_971 [Sphingomonadales bacterium]|jgi:hypothetical protein|nr:hypothetical protein [Sphingomonadales bacterium]
MSEHKPISSGELVPAPLSTAITFEPARLRPRHDGWTAEKQIAFIEALAVSKCVDEACRRVGMSDTSKGEQVGEYRHFDERLTMFLLRSRRAARYGK